MGPRRSPAKRVRWGKEEQWSDRNPANSRGEGCAACDDAAVSLLRTTLSVVKDPYIYRGCIRVTDRQYQPTGSPTYALRLTYYLS